MRTMERDLPESTLPWSQDTLVFTFECNYPAQTDRYSLGGVAIIVRSFARIHETNLKKQGILPLTFADPKDYDRVPFDAKVSLLDLQGLAPGKQVVAKITPKNGSPFEIKLNQYVFLCLLPV